MLRGMQASSSQAVAELLQRVASGDLRVAPLVDESTDAVLQLPARGRALVFQTLEPRPIDRLERKAALKAGLRSGLDRGSRFERAPAPGIGLVALEADGLALGANRPAHPAGAAQHAWAFALQLPARQRIPLSFNSLSRRGRDRSFHGGESKRPP